MANVAAFNISFYYVTITKNFVKIKHLASPDTGGTKADPGLADGGAKKFYFSFFLF